MAAQRKSLESAGICLNDPRVESGTREPVTAVEFVSLIEDLGPFSDRPKIAVGVSGGPDSLALTLLLADWATARGGMVHALTVDHGLRPESAIEARQVAEWLSAKAGIQHQVLLWEGPKPSSAIQHKAREARYRLMTGWCLAHGITDLAVAHQHDDQIETYLIRKAHGSGAMGLAGMSAVRDLGGVRLLRPLLSIPKSRLIATLKIRGQAWIEDPSNANEKFERVRMRRSMNSLDLDAIDRAIDEFGRSRSKLEAEAARLIAANIDIRPEGYVLFDPQPILHAGEAVASATLDRLIRIIGGQGYGPSPDQLNRLRQWMASANGPGKTLGGCHLAFKAGKVLIAREWVAIQEDLPVEAGDTVIWDRRFCVKVLEPQPGLSLRPLGGSGLRLIGQSRLVSLRRHRIPEPARKALPSLWKGSEVLSVPHLGIGTGLEAVHMDRKAGASYCFTVASAAKHTI